MHESLGIAIDDSSISTALVDADDPQLGPIDEYHYSWGGEGSAPSAQASARALSSAAEIATERASRSDLHPRSVGVVCERADVRGLTPDAISGAALEEAVLVEAVDARMAYLRTVTALSGVSLVLAWWADGEESVIAAIDPETSVTDSVNRYETADLLQDSATFAAALERIVASHDPVPKRLVAMGTAETAREMAAEAAEWAGLGFLYLGESRQLAIGAALVAAEYEVSDRVGPRAAAAAPVAAVWRPGARVWTMLLILAGLLIGLLFTLAPDRAGRESAGRHDGDATQVVPDGRPGSRFPDQWTPSPNQTGEESVPAAPPPVDTLAPCESTTLATPAVLHRSDPDQVPTSTPPPTITPPSTRAHVPLPTCIPTVDG